MARKNIKTYADDNNGVYEILKATEPSSDETKREGIQGRKVAGEQAKAVGKTSGITNFRKKTSVRDYFGGGK